MTNRTAAGRYARALMEVVLAEKGELERVEQELAEFSDLVKGHAKLQRLLLNPAVPTPRKRAAIVSLTTSAKTSTVVSKLLALLAERDRLVLLPDLVAAYRERLLDYRQVVRVEVTTAAPMPAGKAGEISNRLAAFLGRTMAVRMKVDPTIVGGLIAKVGSTVYDASVRGQLQRMKERLTET